MYMEEEKGTWKVRKRKVRIYSPLKQRVLLLLATGVALSFAGTIGKQLQIIKEAATEWKEVEKQYLKKIIREFHEARLVSVKESPDGTSTIVLTEKGRKRALTFNKDEMKIPRPAKWDGRWHVVIFDIPEKHKMARNSLREKLIRLGFCHWQKSAYVYPYPCHDQIDFIVEFFSVRSYVRYGVMTDITNEDELKLYFNLQ